MKHTIRAGLALAALVLVSGAGTLRAQSPTPEGTVISNIAKVSWTDANGNAYAEVADTVSFTVGFLAGIDVASAASVTPPSPSTGNELAFTIDNLGNGVDTFTVSTAAAAGVTISGYKIGATTYADLAALNAALDATEVPAGGNVVVTVVYTVAAGMGGQSISLALTATSQRSGTTADSSTTSVTPPTSVAVSVTPDAGAQTRLPSNGTQYTETFTVTNDGNGSETFALAAALVPGGALTIVSVNGTAGTAGSVTVAAGASANVDVVYTVGDVVAGTVDELQLTATSTTDGTTSDAGSVQVTVVRAALAITKEAYRDDQTTLVAGDVLPGEFIQYKVTVANSGQGGATTVKVTDALPAPVTYVSSSTDAAGWTISESGGTVTADLANLASGTTRHFWIRVQVK